MWLRVRLDPLLQACVCGTVTPKRSCLQTCKHSALYTIHCLFEYRDNGTVTLNRNFHQEGVIHVVFSLNNGHLLGAIGNDMYHSLAVYKWQENQILFTTRTNTVT